MEFTKYILKHNSGTYQLNISIDIEELKRRVREGKELLTLFDSTGGQVTKSVPFLDECEIKVDLTDNPNKD